MAGEHKRKAVSGKFYLHNLLGRKFDDIKSDVSSIVFPTVDSGYLNEPLTVHRIRFKKFVTEKAAIEAVEAYLGVPLEENYYNRRRKFLDDDLSWEEAKKEFPYRGSIMKNWIVKIIRTDGTIELQTES